MFIYKTLSDNIFFRTSLKLLEISVNININSAPSSDDCIAHGSSLGSGQQMQQLLIAREQFVISSVHQVEDVPRMCTGHAGDGMEWPWLFPVNVIIRQPAGLHDLGSLDAKASSGRKVASGGGPLNKCPYDLVTFFSVCPWMRNSISNNESPPSYFNASRFRK